MGLSPTVALQRLGRRYHATRSLLLSATVADRHKAPRRAWHGLFLRTVRSRKTATANLFDQSGAMFEEIKLIALQPTGIVPFD